MNFIKIKYEYINFDKLTSIVFDEKLLSVAIDGVKTICSQEEFNRIKKEFEKKNNKGENYG